MDGAVLALNDSVHPRVVHRNVNVSYAIPVCKPVEHRDVGCAVVCNDLSYCSPPTQYLLKDEGSYGAPGLHSKRVPLWPSCE